MWEQLSHKSLQRCRKGRKKKKIAVQNIEFYKNLKLSFKKKYEKISLLFGLIHLRKQGEKLV
jgi:hypothetical protein